jgi:LuxR family maltose regulon positive regulatory protein
MANNTDDISINNANFTSYYMTRPRLDKIFDEVTTRKLVYVIAGDGYGKTQAVRHYIEKQEGAVVRWIHLTESDNIGSRYWENFTHAVSSDNKDLAVKLRELGFPETLARFKQFAEIVKNEEHRAHKTFLVLDDFHLIHSKQALTFAQRCAYLQVPDACVIIISRKEPEINTVSLFAEGKAGVITEDELRFTDEETADFLKHCDVPVSARNIPRIADATKGWTLAVKMLSLILKRTSLNKTPPNLDYALDTIKENIFKLFEFEAWADFPEEVQKIMVGSSLLSELPLTPLTEIFDYDSIIQREQSTSPLSSFMWYDSFVGDYRIQPLYSEFLRSKSDVLSDEEKQNIYKRTVKWCSENGFYTDAMNYYAKLRQFDDMLKIFLSYPFKLPRDSCEYFLNILENLEDTHSGEESYVSLLFLKGIFIPLMLVGAGRHKEAEARCADTIREWENSDAPFALSLLYTAYSNLAYIDTYTCLFTHRYDFAKHLKKALESYKLSSAIPIKITGAFAIADVRSYACLVGEGASLQEFHRFLDSVRETALYIDRTPHNMYCGYDDLAACEIAYFKNRLEESKNHAHKSILKAREKGQYSIAMAATGYLLLIAVYEGDSLLAKEVLKHLGDYLDISVLWNRQLLYDLFTGVFYAYIGLPELAPSWLVIEEHEPASEIHIPVRELIVCAKLHITSKRYSQALTILCNSYPRAEHERFVSGELKLTLLIAVARINTGDSAGAIADFEKAYRLSYDGVFEMAFIEIGREMHTLVTAALNSVDCAIPKQWLKQIDRKASIYAKKSAVIAESFENKASVREYASLSAREREVLNDMYHGLSREEIAVNRYLSINTVKKLLQSIYIKLDAHNNIDAVRIALEKNLID